MSYRARLKEKLAEEDAKYVDMRVGQDIVEKKKEIEREKKARELRKQVQKIQVMQINERQITGAGADIVNGA